MAVVGLAKVESTIIERMVAAAGFPHSFVGVVIATLVLLPETLAAVRAARQGRMQISLNLAYGSAMASIGLTIPAIALASIWIRGPLLLGLGPTQLVLLALTVVVSVLTVVPGRATRLQGEVHLVLLAASFFLRSAPSRRRPAAPGGGAQRLRSVANALSAWVSMLISLEITSSTLRSVSMTNVVRLTGINLPSRPRLTPNWVATVPPVSDSSG